MNLLFICSKNEWRSRTAEDLFKKDERFHVRSAGTSRTARIKVSRKLIDWADWIFVMEKMHRRRLEETFRNGLERDRIIVLDIPDEYPYMDEELVAMLREEVDYFLESHDS